jgi:hypothetical protein
MISTTSCYYYVLYGWSADMRLALVHGGKKKRNCFQFYYSNSPLTMSSSSELYHALLLLDNYVSVMLLSRKPFWKENYGRWSFGATFGSNYPLFLKSNFHRDPCHSTKTKCLWPTSTVNYLIFVENAISLIGWQNKTKSRASSENYVTV